MIDNFSLGVSHGLMLLAVWLLLRRPGLDREDASSGKARSAARWRRRPDSGADDA